jgi:signal transduction histidine kinase
MVQFAVLVTATTAVVLAAGGWLLSRETLTGMDLLNQAEFVEIRDRLGPHPESLTPQEVDRRVRSHTELDAALYFFQIHSDTSALLFRSVNLGPAVLPDLTGGPLQRTEELAGLGQIRLAEYYYGPLHVQIASPLAPAHQLLEEYAQISIFLLGAVAVASIGLGWGFARLTLRPVRAIHDTATRIRADNLGERIAVPDGRDELAALARLLNRMFDGLEASFAQIKRFTAEASHELKTPLALMRLNAEKLRPRLAADPDGNAALDEILEENERLRRIADSLLFLAKIESGTLAITTEEIAADEFVRDFAEDAVALGEDCSASFVVTRSDHGMIRCEPALIRQLLLNLVANALRVSPPTSCVRLDSELSERVWRLTVLDEGPGLPSEQWERVFERFVRYPPTSGEDRGKSGNGLGLAICRSIAALHDGKIVLANRTDRSGLLVEVTLPRAAAE